MTGLVALAAFTLGVFIFPEWWTDTRTPGLAYADRIVSVAGLRQSLLFIGGGLLATVGIYYTHQRHVIERATNKLQLDSNYTDRYTAAITQLGSDQLTIRLGGVYALERVARDSEVDREAVQDVLAAFIRADAPRAIAELDYLDRDPSGSDEFELPIDVAAATTVLSRRRDGRSSDRPRLDLRGVRLNGYSFPSAHLEDFELSNASLVGVKLDRANLVGVNMDNAVLAFASMREANLRNANFNGARLNRADFHGSDMASAYMDGANLSGATLTSTNLASANLSYADLNYANLSGADLKGAILRKALLDGATLTDARNWSTQEFESALGWDSDTKWPDGFSPSVPIKRALEDTDA